MAIKVFRGARPSPRHRLAAAMPHVITGPTPPQVLYQPAQLSFWLNNQYGDCVSAEEAFAKACYTPEIFITDATVLAFAQQNNLLNGADLAQVLDLMESNGFQQDGHTYDDGPNVAVNWADAATLQNAIAHGPVKIGIAANQLDLVWQAHPSNGWIATGFNQDSNEDHCVSLCGYGSFSWLASQLGVTVPSGIDGGTPGWGMFTWDTIGIIDNPSLQAITGEAWLRNPTTVVQ
ncbi:MAG: hypothetical protein ACLQG3_10995 [Terracidiphilus sp.]